jgi:hypothetical protein
MLVQSRGEQSRPRADVSRRAAPPIVTLAPAVLALAAGAWLTRSGLALTSDSVQYLAAGARLPADHALLGLTGEPFTKWPPLVPLVIAAIAAIGLPLPGTLRLVNLLAYALTAGALGRYLYRTTRHLWLALAGALAIVLHPWMGYVHGHLWSEPLFLLWSVLALTQVHSPTRLAAFTALASLTRYVGVSLVPVGVVALLADSTRSRPARAARAALFAAGSLAPLALWAWRDWLLTGTLFGPRAESVETWRTAIADFSGAVLLAAAPQRVASLMPGAWWFVLLMLAWAAAIYMARRRLHTPAGAALLWAGAYGLLLVAATARMPTDPFGPRLFVPLLAAAALALPLLRPTLLFVAAAAWICVMGVYRDGSAWADVHDRSPLRLPAYSGGTRLPIDAAHVVSNWPEAAFLDTGQRVVISPRRTPYRSTRVIADAELAALRRAAASGRTLLLWYERQGASQLLSFETLAAATTLERIGRARGLTIYIVHPYPSTPVD